MVRLKETHRGDNPPPTVGHSMWAFGVFVHLTFMNLDSCQKEQNFALLSIGREYSLVENKSLFNIKWFSILCLNPNMYIVNSNKTKIKKFITEIQKYETKVVGNGSSYCSKFFLFWWNLKNEVGMAKNIHYFMLFVKLAKINVFWP